MLVFIKLWVAENPSLQFFIRNFEISPKSKLKIELSASPDAFSIFQIYFKQFNVLFRFRID